MKKVGFLVVWLFLGLVLSARADTFEDYLANAYCQVDGTRVIVGNIIIGENAYQAQWELNPGTLNYEFSSYEVQNENEKFINAKDVFLGAFQAEAVDPNSPELAEFNTEGCEEIWKYYCPLCHAYRFVCFTRKNYLLLGANFDNGVKLITLEAEGLPLYLTDKLVATEKARFKLIRPDNSYVVYEGVVALTANRSENRWTINVFYSGPSFGTITKYEYDTTTKETKVYKIGGAFEEAN